MSLAPPYIHVGKRCLVYCGDDRCDCDRNTRLQPRIYRPGDPWVLPDPQMTDPRCDSGEFPIHISTPDGSTITEAIGSERSMPTLPAPDDITRAPYEEFVRLADEFKKSILQYEGYDPGRYVYQARPMPGMERFVPLMKKYAGALEMGGFRARYREEPDEDEQAEHVHGEDCGCGPFPDFDHL